MTTHAATVSSIKGPARAPATIRADDPTLLSHTELDAVAAGGGPVGANPSRNGLRLVKERA